MQSFVHTMKIRVLKHALAHGPLHNRRRDWRNAGYSSFLSPFTFGWFDLPIPRQFLQFSLPGLLQETGMCLHTGVGYEGRAMRLTRDTGGGETHDRLGHSSCVSVLRPQQLWVDPPRSQSRGVSNVICEGADIAAQSMNSFFLLVQTTG